MNLLFGHSFDKPLASRQSGTLELKDGANFLEFFATIPEGAERASHVVDALALIGSGLATGISPGFRVPPKDVVPDAILEERPRDENKPVRGTLSTQRAQDELSFVPKWTLETGYRRYCEWYVDQWGRAKKRVGI